MTSYINQCTTKNLSIMHLGIVHDPGDGDGMANSPVIGRVYVFSHEGDDEKDLLLPFDNSREDRRFQKGDIVSLDDEVHFHKTLTHIDKMREIKKFGKDDLDSCNFSEILFKKEEEETNRNEVRRGLKNYRRLVPLSERISNTAVAAVAIAAIVVIALIIIF